jgi:hypothetical protein
MAATQAKGMAVAVIDHGAVGYVHAYGIRNAKGDPLTPDTVMYGASLTKTVFAYTVMQLVDQGRLKLDTPLKDDLDKPLPSYGPDPVFPDKYGREGHAYEDLASDPRWEKITPRMCLTHSTGFNNFWFVEPDQKLHIHFEPGTRYSYSGEGMILLQFTIEHGRKSQGLGLDVGALTKANFDRLGMTRTSLVWRPDFAANLADGWNDKGEPREHDERSKVRAAGSMDTTISDYDRQRRVRGTDGAIFTFERAANPCDAGFRQIRISCDQTSRTDGFSDLTSPIPSQKAFSIHLHLRANRGGRLWLSGKLVPTGKRPSGGVTILDLEQEPVAFFPNPIDVVQFYIPRVALDEFAYENRTAVVNTLSWPHCEMDTSLKHLGMTVLSSLQRSKPHPKSSWTISVRPYLRATYVYGGTIASPSPVRGQLAPWQARRAKEFLTANLCGDVSLASVAAECNLSVSHFAHAFRRTSGAPRTVGLWNGA